MTHITDILIYVHHCLDSGLFLAMSAKPCILTGGIRVLSNIKACLLMTLNDTYC